MNEVLRVEDLSAGYGDVTVLHRVSLAVGAGEAVALIGSNGAGKSTLLRVLSGLLPVESGVFSLDGESASSRSPSRLARAGVCHIPEGRGIFPGLTVRENLRMFSPRGVKSSDAVELAVSAFPALGPLLRRTAGTLSGGQQQMLAISRASIGQPKVVLVDEASMGLAPIVVDALFDFMSGIQCALVVVEQYVDRVLALADRAYVLDRGRIVASGRSDELDRDSIMRNYLGVEAAGS